MNIANIYRYTKDSTGSDDQIQHLSACGYLVNDEARTKRRNFEPPATYGRLRRQGCRTGGSSTSILLKACIPRACFVPRGVADLDSGAADHIAHGRPLCGTHRTALAKKLRESRSFRSEWTLVPRGTAMGRKPRSGSLKRSWAGGRIRLFTATAVHVQGRTPARLSAPAGSGRSHELYGDFYLSDSTVELLF